VQGHAPPARPAPARLDRIVSFEWVICHRGPTVAATPPLANVDESKSTTPNQEWRRHGRFKPKRILAAMSNSKARMAVP
jgi:hypothetical protein